MGRQGLAGLLSAKALLRLLEDSRGQEKLADILQDAPFPHVHMDHPLDLALTRMGEEGLETIPVVSRFNVNELLVGWCTLLTFSVPTEKPPRSIPSPAEPAEASAPPAL